MRGDSKHSRQLESFVCIFGLFFVAFPLSSLCSPPPPFLHPSLSLSALHISPCGAEVGQRRREGWVGEVEGWCLGTEQKGA